MSATIRGIGPLSGTLSLPGDKSISHRALIFNALAAGQAQVRGILDSEDVRATARCLAALGVSIAWEADAVTITGRDMALSEPDDVLDCGNSGTTMRLLAGVLAGQPMLAVLTGDDSLRRRPMARVTDPLRQLGARIDGRDGGRLAPLTVRGGALQCRTARPAVASAQVKTALLLAGLQGRGVQEIIEPHPSRDHSARMLVAMGVALEAVPGRCRMPGGQRLQAVDVLVPGDISSAVFFVIAASITPGSALLLRDVGLNTTRAGALAVLTRMGADITVQRQREVCGEPIGDLLVRAAPLRGTTIRPDEIPSLIDELPALAVAAAAASGRTTVAGAGELRVKESDRIAATADMIAALGGRIEERPDGFVVEGGLPLHGAVVHARGDHRIAMAGAIAGLRTTDGAVLVDPGCMAVSFPDFLQTLERVGGGVQ